MKTRFTTIGTVLLFLIMAAGINPAANAQTPDSLAIEDQLLKINSRNNDGRMYLEVAGFQITLGQNAKQNSVNSTNDSTTAKSRRSYTKKGRGHINIASLQEIGFNSITAPRWKGSHDAGFEDFYNMRISRSAHYSIIPASVSFYLDRPRKFSFDLGFQYTIDNYRFAQPNTTAEGANGKLCPVALPDEAEKSKMRATYLGIPLGFTYKYAHHCDLSLLIYNDFLMTANAITKYPKEKHFIPGFRNYQFGCGAICTFWHVGFYVRYSFLPLLNLNQVGPNIPNTHNLSFGVAIKL